MATEDIDPAFEDLDLWGTGTALAALHQTQVAAVAAVGPALPAIAAAAEAAAPRLKAGGRLIYAGAGTSARIGVQDGAELFPTFSWPGERVAFLIAGGETALLRAVENAEDSGESAASRVTALGVGANDVLIAAAASGETPFTLSAVRAARERGALTIGIANNAGSSLLSAAEHGVLLDTGAEPVAGSTRMKAGTAQKVALNLLSTMLMVKLGRVYRGQMVHVQATNAKLRRRVVRMVSSLTGRSEEIAERAVADAGGDLKIAVLMLNGVEREQAEELLKRHDGNLRRALDEA